MLKKILPFIIFTIVVFVSYLFYNTLTFTSKQIAFDPIPKAEISDSAIIHLSQAIQIKTISTERIEEFDSSQFRYFSNFIDQTYPNVQAQLDKTIINKFSYLYEWKGRNSTLKPMVLVAHTDVVPVPHDELDEWTVPPFSGEVHSGVIWGRGAMDDKVSVIGLMEAVEHLLLQGFTPIRTVYLAFGYDEEIGGLNGAQAIVAHMKAKGIKPEFVLDEGFAITRGLVPGVLTDVALIGTAEKGFATLKLSTELEGGHSSMPNEDTAIKIIAEAIANLEKNPLPPKITKPVNQFLEYVGPEMRFQEKLVFANKALLEGAILGIYQQTPSGRAVVQTTMVPTIFNGGIKDNVVPATATASINFRILPGSSIDKVIEHVKKNIDDDRIRIELKPFHSNPSKVSSVDTKGYYIINQTIKEVFPEVLAVPNLVIAATDGRYYEAISDNIYRFLPIRLNPENVKAMHGINENIPVTEFEDVIRFYARLIENSQ